MRVSVLYFLLLAASLIYAIDGQDDGSASFVCGDPNTADFLDLGDFDSVEPQLYSSGKCHDDKAPYAPGKIYWHVYTLADENARSKISMYPEGIVIPFVKSNTLKFRFNKEQYSFERGDWLEVGVNIYVPASQVQKIRIDGVDQVVEIVNDSTYPLQVSESGVDNKVYVSSPNSKVAFKTTGVDSLAKIESDSGSSVDATGIGDYVEIKTTYDDTLTIDIEGVDVRVVVEGSHKSVSMSGIDGNVSVNNNGASTSCQNVNKAGIDNQCSIVSGRTVTIEELDCLVESEVHKQWDCSWLEELATAAIVATVVVLVVLICCCVAACYGCYRCTKYNSNTSTVGTKEQPPGAIRPPVGVDLEANKQQQKPVSQKPVSETPTPLKGQPSLGDPEQGLPIASASPLPGDFQPNTTPPMVEALVIDKEEEVKAADRLIKTETGA